MSDDDAFLKKLAYTVTPLNIPGAYSTPLPPWPAGFDPMTASPKELFKQGLLVRRPGPDEPSYLLAVWKKVFARQYQPEDRIVPELEPQVGKTHNLSGMKKTDTGITTTVWSGGMVDTGTWGFVAGEWKIPTVSKPKEPQGTEGGWDSSSWIGIDGWWNDDVVQIGIEQSVSAKGVAAYIPWVEWWVKDGDAKKFPYINQTNIKNLPVTAGDDIICSVQYGNNSALLLMFNITTGKNASITLQAPKGAGFKGSSVEWIMENPDCGEPKSSLAKFTPVNFVNAFGCTQVGQTVANPANGDYCNIVTGNTSLTAVTLANLEVTIKFIG